MAQPEPELRSGSAAAVHGRNAKTEVNLELVLINWTAASVKDLKEAETEQKFLCTKPPDWKCIACKKVITCTPVYQVLKCSVPACVVMRDTTCTRFSKIALKD